MFPNKPNMLSPRYPASLGFPELELQTQIRAEGTKENSFGLSWFGPDPCRGGNLGRTHWWPDRGGGGI